MKNRTFKFGKFTIKAYLKKAGHGYEVGLNFGTKPIFIGNFVKATEANKWWTFMNKEVRTFTTRYWVGANVPKNFYSQFFSAHLYKQYYSFLDKLFNKHNRTYNSQFNKEFRKYRQLKKNWKPSEKIRVKAA